MTRLLRDELHYDGLVFTDSMGMGGVTAKFSNAEATVRAVEAGADIILLPPNTEESFRAIKSAIESGRISAQRIEESARRILRAKARLDLENHRFVDISEMMATVGSREHRELAQSIADRAITLVRDDRHVLPLRPSPDLRVAQINILDSRAGWREGPVGRVVTDELPKRFPRAVTVQIDDQSTASDFDIARELAQASDVLVVNAYVRVAAYKGSIDLTRDEITLIRALVAMNKPLVFVDYGSPFVLTHLPELPSYIVTYDTTPLAELAAVRAITGEIPFQGKLPVNLPGLYAIGHGLGGRPSECGGLPPP
jgi:beta-N-acetylhexosaminidase